MSACSGSSENPFQNVTFATGAGSSATGGCDGGDCAMRAGSGGGPGAGGQGGEDSEPTTGASGEGRGVSGDQAEGGDGASEMMQIGVKTTGLSLGYSCRMGEPQSSSIGFTLQLENTGDSDETLEGVSIRYYLTNEAASAAPIVDIDYAAVSAPYQACNSNITSKCSSFGPKDKADVACEMSFHGLSPLASHANVQMQLRIHAPAYEMLDQTNDYSFDASKTSLVPWARITVYRMGALVWGAEP